jgi:carbamoyltransferase
LNPIRMQPTAESIPHRLPDHFSDPSPESAKAASAYPARAGSSGGEAGRARYYLGFSTTFHDPALAILDESGEVLFAEASERYLQDKRAYGAPPDHILRVKRLIEEFCDPEGEFEVASSWSRTMHHLLNMGYVVHLFDREKIYAEGGDRWTRYQLPKYATAWVQTMQMKQKETGANLAFRLRHDFGSTRLRFRNFAHHETHAAYACAGSPFEEAVCLVADGFGEASALASYHFEGERVRLLSKNRGFASLGFYYKELTQLCGFDWVAGEEWKVMGLAPYGRLDPEIHALLSQLYRVEGRTLRQASRKRLAAIHRELARFARVRGSHPESVADLAFTGQVVFSEIMERLLRHLHGLGLSRNLVLCGGCALNSSFNGTVLGRTPFEALHVPSAPGDDGNALGAALLAWQSDHAGEPLPRRDSASPYLGSRASSETLAHLVRFGGFPKLRHLPGTVHEEAARIVAEGGILGWFQGKAEFGPRSLGNRSILADPRSASMKERINARVKFREEYRPFAPSILHEHGPAYFEDYQESRYMERTLKVREEMRGRIPAVVHVDGTARLQTVKREWNPRFHALVERFHEITGVPALLNTSFNVMGKPIVHSVEDALATFLTSGIDALVIEDTLVEK